MKKQNDFYPEKAIRRVEKRKQRQPFVICWMMGNTKAGKVALKDSQIMQSAADSEAEV